jgi:hypothetical protein
MSAGFAFQVIAFCVGIPRKFALLHSSNTSISGLTAVTMYTYQAANESTTKDTYGGAAAAGSSSASAPVTV